jgi:peptidoglycan/xylan/chitin deacetylase (PgdA/CDA1 family)
MKRGAILAYHRVGELVPDTFHLCVAPERFRAHLRLVRERYWPMPLDQFAAALGRDALPERAVAVTLDDGTIDHLTTAAAILEEEKVPATMFVSSGGLGEEYWWDGLERIFSATEELREAHAQLLKLSRDEIETRLIELARDRNVDLVPRPSHRALTGSEIRELSRRCAIGVHGAHHLWLPAQSDEVRRAEVAGAKAALEQLIDREIPLFAYPFGAHDEATVEAARAAGFHAAVTVEQRTIGWSDPPLLLPRIDAAGLDDDALAALLDA